MLYYMYMHISLSLYIYIYIERERERNRERERDNPTYMQPLCANRTVGGHTQSTSKKTDKTDYKQEETKQDIQHEEDP